MSNIKIGNWEILPFCDDPFCPEDPNRDAYPMTPGTDAMTLPMVQRRCARLDISHVDPPVYFGYLGRDKNRLQIKQIAEFGAGVWAEGVTIGKEARETRFSHITIGDIRIPVRCRFLYSGDRVAGIEFVEPTMDTRLAIRSHFFIEHAAANVSPAHYYGRRDEGQFHKMTFTNDEVFHAEVLIMNNRLTELIVNLEHTETVFRWYGTDPDKVHWGTEGDFTSEEIFRQLLGIFRNVRGLNPSIRDAVESILVRIKQE